jgi:hypothetical protein
VCGSEIEFSTHGTLSSPGSPGRYPNNRDCYWTLIAPYSRRIQFHFFTMQIEASSNCSKDYLEVCMLSLKNLIEFIPLCYGTCNRKPLNSMSNRTMFLQLGPCIFKVWFFFHQNNVCSSAILIQAKHNIPTLALSDIFHPILFYSILFMFYSVPS